MSFRKRILLGNAFILCALLMSCNSKAQKSIVVPSPSKGSNNVSGVIINNANGGSVSNASVTLYPPYLSTTTDSAGHFIFNGVSDGSYQISVSKEGYIRYMQTISISRDSSISVVLKQSSLPFHAGVTFNIWFQPNTVKQFNFGMYSKQDFINAQLLGCDVIRLPINLNYLVTDTFSYTLDPIFLNDLDQVVNWAESLKMYLILDNHSYYASGITPSMEPMLLKVWQQMAAHYAGRSSYILYETLNEPHDLPDTTWGRMQQQIINTIRSQDKKHTIMVDADNYDSYNNLGFLPKYSDDNLVYDFHFYDPMVFTHQGASFINPPLTSLLNVPFPYNPNSMPQFPSSLDGTWFQQQFNDYQNRGTVANLQKLINVAIAFRDSAHEKIFCGEFGVLNDAPDNDRVFWYQSVRSYLEQNNIPFTIWDYKDVFGIFKPGSTADFPRDLNIPLVRALNFNVPQTN